ncbi:MAG: hypothetical protein J7M32_09210 [Deltaproteobacteria bacterium]|nr:hypothetical protein [Deltaproteobacteria bacterium]
MELDTFIVEEDMDLGEAQDAYENYHRTAERLREKLADYRALVENLSAKGCTAVTRQQKEKGDNLYEELKDLQQERGRMRAALSQKTDELVVESKGLEVDLAYHSRDLHSEEEIQLAQTLLSEAMRLKEDRPVSAVEKACRARDMLSGLLVHAVNEWIGRHKENLDGLMADPG